MKKTMKKTLSLILSLLMVVSCFTGIITTVQATGVSPIAGDINGDGATNNKDLTRLMKYLAGEDIEVVTVAIDPNGDGTANNKDLTRLMRYIAGDDVEIFLSGCTHEKEEVAAVEATCTAEGNIAYWYCADCDKYFSDAEGVVEITLEDTVVEKLPHTEEVIPGYPATTTETGLTDGVRCSVCDTTLVEQEIIPITEYSIIYEIDGNDTYLTNLLLENKIENLNPVSYSTETGWKLKNISVPGYIFEGWYDAPGSSGEIVKEIAAGTTGEVELYAKWTKVVYTITFDSPEVYWDDVTYTVDIGKTLTNPSWFGYTFVGWSEDGKIVKEIPVGTIGNKTLHANWTSDRNKAVSKQLTEPEIIEDLDNNRYLFVYEIGEIENVPLNLIVDYGKNESVLEVNKLYEYSQTVNEKFIETAATAVSNATTKTSSWTLSEDWNKSTSATNEHEEENGKTDGKTDSQGNVYGSQYYVSNSSGGSTSSSSSAGGSSSTSSKVTTDTSTGISNNYSRNSELDTSVDLSVEASVGAGWGPVSAEVSAGVSTNVSTHDEESFNTSNYRDTYVGTYDEQNSNSYWNTSNTSSASWNSTNSYQTSSSTSTNSEVSSVISEVIYDRWGYSSTEDRGGGSSETNSTDETKETTEEYVSTIERSTEEREVLTTEINKTFTTPGYYRLVTAGKLHVFAVVGYDVATKSYFTYTYSVLDEERYDYIDYSKEQSDYDDCENAILPFEVPFEVHEYISDVTARSEGLTISSDGIVTAYNGSATYVVIPEYTTGGDSTSNDEAIRVRGIDSNAFAGNTTIKAVSLPKYISEIPDDAFAGCTSLESVFGYSITSVGDNAFAGCNSLKNFTVDEYFNSIGDNAFDSVTEITVKANPNAIMELKNMNKDSSEDIAEAKIIAEDVVRSAIYSGANRITVDVSALGTAFSNETISVDDSTAYFAIVNNNVINTYNNLKIVSNAKETYLGGMTFVGNTDTPLKLNSEKVTLSKVTVEDAPGFALILPAENTDLYIYDTIALASAGENAVISKDVNVEMATSTVTSKLQLKGDYLVCGTLTDNTLLDFTDGEVREITEEEFDSYLTSSIITFNPNEGVLSDDQTTIIVYYGQLYGELPVPTREHYSFLGWFTEPEGGTEVTAESTVEALVNQTLYAHWSRNAYKVNFNANGGSVATESKQVESGGTYGELPTPTRTGWTFKGWYTATSGGTQITSTSTVSISDEQTLYAMWQVNSYTVKWSTGTGYTITVKRTSSPNAGASTGTLSSGATVYYGDVLSVTYTASTGYSISSKGSTSITVTGNVTSSNIYASASANSYTYTIKYVSTNGTALGSSSATYKYGTTNTITAPAKSGYTTPSSQSIKWDSTSKTITFKYSPSSVTNSTKTGTLDTSPYVTYSAKVEYQNRTASSVQVRVVWTSTIGAYYYDVYGQNFRITSPVSSGNTVINSFNTWKNQVSYARSSTGTSSWVTIPLSTTNATTVNLKVYYFQTNANGTDMTSNYDCYGGTYTLPVNIPAY